MENILCPTDEKAFTCEVCLRGFSRKADLKSHRRIHTHEKPFICEVCPKKFSHNPNLKKHVLCHTSEKTIN